MSKQSIFKIGDQVIVNSSGDKTDYGRISSIEWDFDHWIFELNGKWYCHSDVIPSRNGLFLTREVSE